MATDETIIREIESLDAAFPATRFMNDKQRVLRQEAAIDVLSEFSDQALRQARIELLKIDTKDPPSIPNFYAACENAQEEITSRSRPKPKTPDVPRSPHTCTPPPIRGEAINWLRIVARYEAVHVRCQGKILATCFICGIRHGPVVSPAIALIQERFPNETKDWNPYHKGYIPCERCEPRTEENQQPSPLPESLSPSTSRQKG